MSRSAQRRPARTGDPGKPMLAKVSAVLERARRVRLMLFDVDGVLTDGRLWYGPSGEAMKAFHVLDGFLDMVETVSPGPYLELFVRRQRLGWVTWGNEALEHVELTALQGAERTRTAVSDLTHDPRGSGR